MFTDPVHFLNGLLDELGEEQDADEWSYDRVLSGQWFTANHPTDGRLVEVFVEHVSADACGYTALSLTRTRLAAARPRIIEDALAQRALDGE